MTVKNCRFNIFLLLLIVFLFNCSTSLFANNFYQNIDSVINTAKKMNSSNHIRAAHLCDSALDLCIQNKYWKGEAEVLRVKGLSLFYAVKYTDALKLFIESKSKYEKLNDNFGVALANNMIAIVYNYLGFHDKSLILHKENLELRYRIQDNSGIATTINNIGVVLKNLNRQEEALSFYKNAFELEKKSNDWVSLGRYYDNIGQIFLDINKLDSAFFYLSNGLELRLKINDRQGIKNSYESLGQYHFKKASYQKAMEYQEKSLQIAYEIGIVYEIESITAELANTYAKLGMFKKSYETILIYQKMKDSINESETAQLITKSEMEKTYENEKKIQQLQIEKQEMNRKIEIQKDRNDKMILIFLTISLIITSIAILFRLLGKRKHNKQLLLQQQEILRQNEEITAQNESISQQNDALLLLNSEKDKFFSIIAHDLKSPFAGFLGLTKIIAEEYHRLSPKEIQEYGNNMQDSAINLFKLLENLLEWSRIQRGITEFNPETCFLKYIVKQNIDIQIEVAKQKQIELVSHIHDDINLIVDVSMLNTILRNLLSNAIKFTPRGGKIEIGTNVTYLDNEKTIKNNIEVYVRDNGIGMSQEIMDKLFKINEKTSKPGTENEPSTGLGLLLCQEFAEKNNGQIRVESIEGTGTTFILSLPA